MSVNFITDIHFTPESFKSIKFSAGELHTKCVNTIRNGEGGSRVNYVHVLADIASADDLIELALANEILDRHFPRKHVQRALTIPYLPYSRQDRVTEPGTAFSLKVCADIINMLEFDKVTTWDCHSDVGTALVRNCVSVPQHEFVKSLVTAYRLSPNWLIAPDAGAAKKVGLASHALGIPFAIANKARDLPTGEVTEMRFAEKIFGDVLIVDDIVDGGWTFIKLAEALKKAGASRISLYTTHGIYAKGLQPLLDAGIDNFYCAHIVGNYLSADDLLKIQMV